MNGLACKPRFCDAFGYFLDYVQRIKPLNLILPDKFHNDSGPFLTFIFLNEMAGVHDRSVLHSFCSGYGFLEMSITASGDGI